MKKILFALTCLVVLGGGCTSKTNDVVDQVSKTDVDMSGFELTQFPEELLKNKDVEVLNISNNQLTGALPAEINRMKQLRVLDASDNQFTGIPAEIGQLSNLEIIDFSYNELTGIPHEIGNLQNLKRLDLTGNDISETDLDVIREALPEGVEIRL